MNNLNETLLLSTQTHVLIDVYENNYNHKISLSGALRVIVDFLVIYPVFIEE